MKLIIAGGRDYLLNDDDRQWLDTIPGVTEVVSGCATGADKGGEEWARSKGIPVLKFPARWSELGKRAGPARNQLMAEHADAVALFPGGRGTDDMRSRAERIGLDIYVRTPSVMSDKPPAVRPPALHNRHHGCVPDSAIYIGRGSKYGNPYHIGQHGSRAAVIRMYYYWLLAQPDLQRAAISELAGKDLVCYCSPLACHGNVLMFLAREGKMPPPPPFPGDSRYIKNICDVLGAEVVEVKT